MTALARYRSTLTDNERWQRFEHRGGDIVISTPPKSGTTWTQMLCALLLFDGPEFPATIDHLSPWLDMLTRSEDEVFAQLATNPHRRFIKTHTPLDGLPLHDDVTYLVVGRDPRDVHISYEHHFANIDIEKVLGYRAAAIGLDDLADHEPPEPPDPDPTVRFRAFVESTETGGLGAGLTQVLHHLRTGWERRHQPNVALFHFADYQRDLVGELVELAAALGVEVSRDRLEELAPEAGLEQMRVRADEVAPDTTKNHWLDTKQFFRTGGSGEWRDRASDADLAAYETRVLELAPPDLAAWVHGGRVAASPG